MPATYATNIIISATMAATIGIPSRHSRRLGRHCQTGRLLSEDWSRSRPVFLNENYKHISRRETPRSRPEATREENYQKKMMMMMEKMMKMMIWHQARLEVRVELCGGLDLMLGLDAMLRGRGVMQC